MPEKPDRYDSTAGDPAALVCRLPNAGETSVTMGSQLVVGDHEVCGVRVGDAVTDVVGPGTHAIGTRSIPIATRILALPYGSESSFEGVLYFLRDPEVPLTLRWGTPRPVAFLDNMFGLAHVRAHGELHVAITNPRVFLRTCGEPASRDELGPALSELIASRFTDALADRVDTLIDLERYQTELRQMITKRLEGDLSVRGMRLDELRVSAMTLPSDVLATIESRGSIGSVRQLREFLRGETTRALTPAATEALDPELAGEGVPEAAESERSSRCRSCHSMLPDGAEFCARCGATLDVMNPCLGCAAQNLPEAVYCHACGVEMGRDLWCERCSSASPPGARYCWSCGNPVQQDTGAEGVRVP